VGSPDPGLVPRRRALRRHGAAAGGGLGARPGRARHVVLLRTVAVRHARLARKHAGAARVLPHGRALNGARHHLPLGRAHGDVRDRADRRDPVHRREHPLGDPGPRRTADVEVARHRDRPARPDCRLRRRRAALRAARDVLGPGRQVQRGPRPAGPRPGQQALERLAPDLAAGGGGRGGSRRRRRGRGPLDRVEARAAHPTGGRGLRRLSLLARRATPTTTAPCRACCSGRSSARSRSSIR
jgi:hypothetical protein